jgi:hypothetical protein
VPRGRVQAALRFHPDTFWGNKSETSLPRFHFEQYQIRFYRGNQIQSPLAIESYFDFEALGVELVTVGLARTGWSSMTTMVCIVEPSSVLVNSLRYVLFEKFASALEKDMGFC